MSDTTAFPSNSDDTPQRADFTKQPAASTPQSYTAPELSGAKADAGALLSTEICVINGTSSRTLDFKAGKDVSYYTGQVGAKVGFARGRTASIDGIRVSGRHPITDGGIIITVNRKPCNG